MSDKIKDGECYSRQQLKDCGWVFTEKHFGKLEIWEQAKENLFYEPSEGKIKGIFQKP